MQGIGVLPQEWEAAPSWRVLCAGVAAVEHSPCRARLGADHTSVRSQNFEKMLGNVKSEQL